MRKLIIALLAVALLPELAYSVDTSLKGFIALDALNYEKIQHKKGAAVIGIGVLDLKVYAEQDDMTAAMKLNLDGNLSVQNNIFEEAYASYRGLKNWKFTLGKGVVRFQNLHWGAVENTFLDGGSILGTENSWRKVSSKALASAGYGGRSMGFINTVTLWGESTEVQFDDKGRPYYTATGSATNKTVTAYSTKSVPAFNTSKQFGIANKLELFQVQDWTFTTGQIFYSNKLAPKNSYAVDFGINKDSMSVEYWLDLLYGFTSKAPFDAYTTFAKTEYFLQMGSQYHFDEIWSVVGNAEFLYTKDLAHTYTPFVVDNVTYNADSRLYLDRSGTTVRSTSYKLESAIQRKLSRSSFLTMGGLYERKISSLNNVKNLSFIKGVNNANAEGFKLATTISFWF